MLIKICSEDDGYDVAIIKNIDHQETMRWHFSQRKSAVKFADKCERLFADYKKAE